MKIGILTFANANNYGAVLQAYASQQFIKNSGHNVQIIDYTPNYPNQKSSDANIIKKLKNKINTLCHLSEYKFRKKKASKLNKFKKECLIFSPTKYTGEINELKENYDIIVAGSDQIWNTDLTFCSKSFFLDFKTKAKKTGYAISVGRENLSQNDCRMIHSYVHNFKQLSVREKSLSVYLKNNENITCDVVCDPVFLLNGDYWTNIAKVPKLSGYIFVYAMEYNNTLTDIINKLTRELNKPAVLLYAGGKAYDSSSFPGKIIRGIGPEEFLGWIKNADIVLTNSFHGAAFSIIFGNKLVILEHSSRNERLVQLTENCKCENKLVKLNSTDFSPEKYLINTKTAYKNLDSLIEKSKKYMLNICQEHIK